MVKVGRVAEALKVTRYRGVSGSMKVMVAYVKEQGT